MQPLQKESLIWSINFSTLSARYTLLNVFPSVIPSASVHTRKDLVGNFPRTMEIPSYFWFEHHIVLSEKVKQGWKFDEARKSGEQQVAPHMIRTKKVHGIGMNQTSVELEWKVCMLRRSDKLLRTVFGSIWSWYSSNSEITFMRFSNLFLSMNIVNIMGTFM